MQGIVGRANTNTWTCPGPHPHTHSYMLTYTVGTIFVAAHNYINGKTKS